MGETLGKRLIGKLTDDLLLRVGPLVILLKI